METRILLEKKQAEGSGRTNPTRTNQPFPNPLPCLRSPHRPIRFPGFYSPPPPAPATNFDPSESGATLRSRFLPPPPPADPAPETLAPPPPPPPAPPAPTFDPFESEGQPLPEVPAPPPPPRSAGSDFDPFESEGQSLPEAPSRNKELSLPEPPPPSSTRAARSDFRSFENEGQPLPEVRATGERCSRTRAPPPPRRRSDFQSFENEGQPRVSSATGERCSRTLCAAASSTSPPAPTFDPFESEGQPLPEVPGHRRTTLRRQTPAQYLLRMFQRSLFKAYRPLLLLILSILRPTTNIKSKRYFKKGQRVRWQPGGDSNPD